MKKYNSQQIEKKWQEHWATNNVFEAGDSGEKKFILVEFPFPSGDGLHMGHLRSYTAADITSRYYRMNGFEVMYPIGWDAFGLPAENYAIKHGKLPAETTAKNIANIKKQCMRLGYSFDWSREINTTDPNYYKWTQWLFLQFYKAGLAYEATGLINWCPKDKTGLANEEVIAGHCERCGEKVEQKELRQWYLKITAYADKLLAGLDDLPDWPEAVKLQQANWIGKSEGEEIEFQIDGTPEKIKVFTTRPDTILGATYLVVAPEHSILKKLSDKIENFASVKTYIEEVVTQEELTRTSEDKEKTGVELKGVKAINPATKQLIPIWVADYVLGGYGTGAIMAVPGHDQRDKEFAQKFNLPIIELVEFAETGKYGMPKTQYKLRDWVFSRQRYWGEPIPIVHCEIDGVVAVPEDQLPVLLPEVKNYQPTGTGESPLAVVDEWVNTTCPKCEGPAKRETNTMPQWAGSSWYYLRYIDSQNKNTFASAEKLKHWLPVDIYFGGMEHTTLHLLYSRFWNIFLYDQGLVPVSEPYRKRVPHGIILAQDGSKMSKSKGNVVNPDNFVKQYGADITRMYEMFLGPHSDSVAWSDQGIVGVARFLERVWVWASASKFVESDSENTIRELHKLIKKITEDIESCSFNTAISAFMQFHNSIKDHFVTQQTALVFLQLLYPFTPHISAELNELLGGEPLDKKSWPKFDSQLLQSDKVNLVFQVNGKTKVVLEVEAGITQAEAQNVALSQEKIISALNGQKPKRVIFVQDKLLNLVL